MPPKAGYKAFRPPRPVASGSEPRDKQQQKGKQPRKIVSSNSEDDTSDAAADEEAAGDVEDVLMTDNATKPKKAEQTSIIPPKLLTRLMHEHFKKDDTRITKEAMSLLVKYVETFTIEAIGRANDEREEAVKKDLSADGNFLEVSLPHLPSFHGAAAELIALRSRI